MKNVILALAILTAPLPAQAEPLSTVRKWLNTVELIEADRRMLARCDIAVTCEEPARRMIALADVNRGANLSAINRSVNLIIKYADDKTDRWQSALDTLRYLEGDCEDIAILKMELLRSLGWSERDMRLVFTRINGVDHAVLAVRAKDGVEVVLDCNRPDVIPASVFLRTVDYVADLRLPFTLNSLSFR